jgi:hypothetical protein
MNLFLTIRISNINIDWQVKQFLLNDAPVILLILAHILLLATIFKISKTICIKPLLFSSRHFKINIISAVHSVVNI